MIEQSFDCVKWEMLAGVFICTMLCYTTSGNAIGYSFIRMVDSMCGRYQFSAEQSAEILQIVQEVQDKCGAKAAETIRQGEITPGCIPKENISSSGAGSICRILSESSMVTLLCF